MTEPYNPLHKKNLGESVADALLSQPIHPMPLKDAVKGAGVYAIYYTGDLKLYAQLKTANRGGAYRWPIYVGKAVPEGSRRGGLGLDADPGNVLHKRLREHAKSLEQAAFPAGDFFCRFLTVDDIWIPLAESVLIEKLHPAWNMVADGFGNHAPGGGRKGQQRSPWDTLHAGRPWAARLPDGKPRAEIERLVKAHIAAHAAKFRG
jgi:hypothetical protein